MDSAKEKLYTHMTQQYITTWPSLLHEVQASAFNSFWKFFIFDALSPFSFKVNRAQARIHDKSKLQE